MTEDFSHAPVCCKPLSSLQEVLDWEPCLSCTPLQQSSLHCVAGKHVFDKDGKYKIAGPLPRKERQNRPRTLVCHDMAGGYLDDRFVKGCNNPEAYRFFHWAGIDTFIYFSHHFVTVPPPGWIHAAHTHGVPVLGTIITEWEEGAERCSELLASEESVEQFIEKMAELALTSRFDGWLLNIENKVELSQVSMLQKLVRGLTSRMYQVVPHSLVLWYDSVISTGELKFQNELNENNRMFFDACDGIFLNYGWTEDRLRMSVRNAGDRFLDVYVGIDVFGRGCLGGGGFNTAKALSVVRSCGMSAALFAPGWVYEMHEKCHFAELEYYFWNLLLSFLFLHGPTMLPFSTSFCQGYGHKLYCRGKVVSEKPWFNLSKQQYQPCFPTYKCQRTGCSPLEETDNTAVPLKGSSATETMEMRTCSYDKDAYNGGTSLLLSCSTDVAESARYRLFTCEFPVEAGMLVVISYKHLETSSAGAAVVLTVEDNEHFYEIHLKLQSRTEIPEPEPKCPRSRDKVLYPVSAEEFTRHKISVPPGAALGEDLHTGWRTCCYIIEHVSPQEGSGKVTDITIVGVSHLLLGWLALYPVTT